MSAEGGGRYVGANVCTLAAVWSGRRGIVSPGAAGSCTVSTTHVDVFACLPLLPSTNDERRLSGRDPVLQSPVP